MSEKIKVKTILIGASGVGKTSFVQAINNQEIQGFQSSTGPSFSTFEFDNSLIQYQLFDTAGQEQYRSIIRPYFRGSKIVILFTSCDGPKCENEDKDLLEFYDDAVNEIGKGKFLPIFILNKIDLAGNDVQQIMNRKNEIEKKVKEHDSDLENSFHLFEISCLTNKNVENTLKDIDQIGAQFVSEMNKDTQEGHFSCEIQ